MEEQAREYIQNVIAALAVTDFEAVMKVVALLKWAKSTGSNVFTFGNGGSAATASHFQNDLVKMCGIKAFCVSDMTPLTLAYGNDTDWMQMFSETFSHLSTPNDVVIAFSCSGNSKNVIYPLWKWERDCATVLFTGDDGGYAKEYANIVVKCAHDDIKVQEDCHLALCHCIAGLLSDAK